MYAVDRCCVVALAMLHMTAAFETIDHAILVSRLTDSGSQAMRLSGSDPTCPIGTKSFESEMKNHPK